MRLHETSLPGAFVVEIEPHADVRGFFARTWCAREFAARGLESGLVQTSISRNERRGTVRGMHMQLPPSHEAKLVRCTRGAILDVIVDLRPDSATYLRHVAVELAARKYTALYIPPMMLHGFQTLADETEVLYQMSDYHAPGLGFGARWDDPTFAIEWPLSKDITILARDAEFPDFDRRTYEASLASAVSAAPAGTGR